ncbi:MAG: spermidine/putrescine transport system permease protein [Kribbellaceae bacterium]|nr:spermidine/putrescine transport system permease protein [Kribbellaceae bacterium]
MSAAQGIGVGEQQQTEDRQHDEGSGRRGSGGDDGSAAPSQPGRWRGTPYLLLLPGMLWLTIFFIVPLVTLLSTSTQTRPSGAEIGVYRQTFRFANYPDSIHEYLAVFGRSFLYALIATVVALAISYPLAYAIAFKAGRWKNLLLVLVVAPFFVSFLLRTIAWKQILADEGWVADILRALHVLGPQSHIINSAPAVVIGITYNFLPFMILPIYASLERVDPRMMEAAGDLYAGALTTLRKVTLPLSLPGVVAGTLLTFIPAAGDYVNAALLGNRNTTMIGNVIDSRFLKIVDYPTAAVLSVSLMVAILVLVGFYIKRAGTEELV